ncbi:AcrR family transcriptional regulator [Bradyrhizobium sp. LM2.7]
MAKSADNYRQLNVTSRNEVGYAPTRDVLIRCGMEVMTQQGFAATGLDALLRRATVPKGSFYHYFESKAEYGREIMKAYDSFFRQKLDRALNDGRLAPLARMRAFVDDAKAGMAKYSYTRGCLVGNPQPRGRSAARGLQVRVGRDRQRMAAEGGALPGTRIRGRRDRQRGLRCPG